MDSCPKAEEISEIEELLERGADEVVEDVNFMGVSTGASVGYRSWSRKMMIPAVVMVVGIAFICVRSSRTRLHDAAFKSIIEEGLIKPKKYDWKDSNLAMFGSDVEKIQKESAETEPAWAGTADMIGTNAIRIWRIDNFKVTKVDESTYGEFYSGDTYIVLKTNADPDKTADIFFWIGKYSTADEYKTAEYKIVELDTLLGDVPVQHREIMGHESTLFKSLFKSINIMKGGADSGFKRAEQKVFKPRMIQFKKQGRRAIAMTEVALKKSNLVPGDCFVIDNGLTIYQYNSKGVPHELKFKAAAFVNTLKEERDGKARVEVLDAGAISSKHLVFELLDA